MMTIQRLIDDALEIAVVPSFSRIGYDGPAAALRLDAPARDSLRGGRS